MKTISNEQREEFEALTRPVIEWLNANFNPHVKVIVEVTGAELTAGVVGFKTEAYLLD